MNGDTIVIKEEPPDADQDNDCVSYCYALFETSRQIRNVYCSVILS